MYLHRLGSWLQRLDAPTRPEGERTPNGDASPPAQTEAVEGDDEETEDEAPPEVPAEVRETLEVSKKLARAQSRQGLQLEELERKLEGGFSGLRTQLDALTVMSRALTVSPDTVKAWDPLLDALDALDAASLDAGALGAESLRDGLRGVRARIEGFLSQNGLRRVAASALGTVPDGKYLRVIGVEDRHEGPEGVVVRVVQAAVLVGSRVLREGSVLVARCVASDNEGTNE